jgi:hypothetical protein
MFSNLFNVPRAKFLELEFLEKQKKINKYKNNGENRKSGLKIGQPPPLPPKKTNNKKQTMFILVLLK